jgi:sec-independent protein translocase protein TatB
MPQIGWLEILIVVIIAVLIIGPKDFPIMLKKIGIWVGSFKNYFSEVQQEITDVENIIKEEIPLEKDLKSLKENKKKDE